MKKIFWLLIWMILISNFLIAGENKSLNGLWHFKTDPYNIGEGEKWFDPKTSYDCWDEMEVPGNWDLHNEYSDYAGDAWYSYTFGADDDWEEKAVRLVFQSVYNDCKVWVNGSEVGENHIGFLPFHFDISEELIYGAENNITLKVNNVFKRGAIWNWGGIRRPVWLEVTDPVRLEYQHITAVPDLKKGTAEVDLKIFCSNKTMQHMPIVLEINITRNGEVVKKQQINTTVPSNSKEFESNWKVKIPKSKVALWSFDYPNLYTCTVNLVKSDKMIQSISDRFGIRKLEVAGTKLLLNGVSIRPVGFNVVPEDRVTGNTLPMERIKEDVDMLKELGVTFCRISHLPLPKEYLDYLDEKGIMTFEEVSLWGKDKWVDPEHPMPKEWLRRMIKEKFNHPSVAGWSVGNEIGFVDRNPKVMEYVKGAIEMTRELDPNRLAVYVTHSAPSQDIDPVKYSDMIMLNRYGNWGNAAQQAWEKHNKPIFMSEYGHELNNEDPNLSEIDAKKMMDDMRNREYLLGASLWTFNDYRSFYYGREGWATPVSQNRCWGIVNTFRQKKRSYDAFREEYVPVRGLAVKNIDHAGKNATVMITPRNMLDIPANTLIGFQLKWSTIENNFELSGRGEVKLKDIYPGDDAFNVDIDWRSARDPKGIKVEILDPQGYSVLDKIIYFTVPAQPEISYVNTAQDGIRLIYSPVDGATEYYALYDMGGETVHSDTTINNFITISDPNLKLNEPVDFQIVAVNNAGVSQPSRPVQAAKDEDELPPVIWGTQRVKDDLVIGFSSTPYDYLYEIEYGFAPGKYEHQVGFKVKGVARIPDVGQSKPVYFRLRVRKQWGFASEWTQEIMVN